MRAVRQRAILLLGGLLCAGAVQAQDAEKLPANTFRLESLDISKMTQGWESPHAGLSVEGNTLKIGGQEFKHGVGTHAVSEFRIALKGAAMLFTALVGVDDEKANSAGSVTFEIYGDGRKLADSGVMRGGNAPKKLVAELRGVKMLTLRVGDAGDGIDSDHADWADALLVMAPGAKEKPEAAVVPVEPPRMVIPRPDPKPRINGARIVGTTPGHDFLFLIPVTGDGPFVYSAKNLPAGLSLDPMTGVISGKAANEGTTVAVLTVKGAKGTAKRSLTIVAGQNKLALTPPMGWNSWNVWAGNVDADKVKAAADYMLKSGLAAHGFQYVNIDDCWEGQRDANGEIVTNAKFGDMKALTDYVHSKGLRVGIYSSPGPKTCAGFEASYQHEQQDANTYAKWGIDYLKYDWCSYGGVAGGSDLPALKKPYFVMRDALANCGRDIVYSLCQYGMGNVWEWGAEVGGNCWRTTGDITDTWGSLYSIYSAQDGHEKYAGPGRWNDPDMLIVGRVGWGNPHPSRLTPNEQLLHISLWSMLASPLLIGCDMARMDEFTVAILSNDEVLDISQDPLGKAAGRIKKDGDAEVWARPLSDGTMAVCLVNSGMEKRPVAVKWSDLKLKGGQSVRDLWLHKECGSFPDAYSAEVPAHGVVMLKVGRPQKAAL